MSGPAGRTIAVGQHERIKVSASSKVRSGWCKDGVGARVTLRTNDAANARLTLVSCSTVRYAMYTEPPFDRFGNLTVTFEPCFWSPAQQTITVGLIRGDGGPLLPEVRELSLHKWDVLEKKFHLQPEQSLSAMIHEVKPGERYDLTVTAQAPWPPSGKSGRVVVGTGVAQQPEYTLGFYLNGSCRLRADPKTFLQEDLRSPAGGRVHLLWSDDWPPGRVVSAEADDPALLVEVLETAEGQDVVVRAPRAYVFPKRWPRVTLHTDDNMMPELRVYVARSRAVN